MQVFIVCEFLTRRTVCSLFWSLGAESMIDSISYHNSFQETALIPDCVFAGAEERSLRMAKRQSGPPFKMVAAARLAGWFGGASSGHQCSNAGRIASEARKQFTNPTTSRPVVCAAISDSATHSTRPGRSPVLAF